MSTNDEAHSMEFLYDTRPMPSRDETLDLVRVPMASIHEVMTNPPTSGATREALKNKLYKLEHQMDVLLMHRRNMKDVIDEMEIERRAIMDAQMEFRRIDVLPDALIVFADVIEKANQYFDFKKTAKEKYKYSFQYPNGRREISDALLHDEQLKSKFNKMGVSEIRTAGNAIYDELNEGKYGRVGTQNIRQDEVLMDWIFNLVFQARENGYVMDQNPIVELQKIMKPDTLVYDTYFRLFWNDLAKCTKSLTEQAHSKYAQFLKDVKTYCGTKSALKEGEDVTKANVVRENSRKNG